MLRLWSRMEEEYVWGNSMVDFRFLVKIFFLGG